MIDINLVKANPGALDAALKARGKEQVESQLLQLEETSRARQTDLQNLLQERNSITEKFAEARRQGTDTTQLSTRMETLKGEIKSATEKADKAREMYMNLLVSIPNIPTTDCPIGTDEAANVEVRSEGAPREFDFTPLEHHELGERLGMMNFERAARIAGSRYVFLTDELARLERALAQFMLDVHTKENGYTEAYVPLILEGKAMFGCGQLPKFEEDLFKTTLGTYLIPTAEVSLTNIFNGEILSEKELPLRFTAYTPCFRSEAGAAGKDTSGMLRQHQFGKVELVSITTPEQAVEEHERMTRCAEDILHRLGLPFRTVVLSTGDMGFSAEKTYDIEVWLPGQGKYREISSCSRCGTFQSRRMNTRFKNEKTKKNEFAHTLNGSGVAVGRCMIALMENYQQRDGSIVIPEKLVPYFGKDKIEANGK